MPAASELRPRAIAARQPSVALRRKSGHVIADSGRDHAVDVRMTDDHVPHGPRSQRTRTIAAIVAYGAARRGRRVLASAKSRCGTDIAIPLLEPALLDA